MKAQSLSGKALFGWCAGLEHMQFLAGLEAHRLAGSDADLGSSTGVATDAGLAGPHAEDTKTTQFDTFAGGESLFKTLEDCIHGSFGLGPGKARALDHMVDDILFNQRKYLAGLSKMNVLRPTVVMLQVLERLGNTLDA